MTLRDRIGRRLPRRHRLAVLVIVPLLVLGGIAWGLSAAPWNRPSPLTATVFSGPPKLEGVPVDRVLGLHQGKTRREVRKLAKPYAGKTVRISGRIGEVSRISPAMAYVSLRDDRGQDSGVSLMFRVEYEPDLPELSKRTSIRATCVFRGKIEPDGVVLEDCRITP